MEQNSQALRENIYHLERGYVYFSKSPMKIHTVLGTAVSVCLWDTKLKIGGMNHYVYPIAESAAKATPDHGNAAIIALLRIMQGAGSQLKDLVAQIFGGGFPDSDDNQGNENVTIARRLLKKRGLKIVSEDVGGSLGRKVVFDTATGQAAVIKVNNIRNSDWQA
jgi:chemotaxis protein CheD